MITLFSSATHKVETSGRLPNEQEKAIYWRDSELYSTDEISRVTDHPKHAEIITYRQQLRDWPSDPVSFPGTKPVSPL